MKENSQKILVTGAAGFIGMHTCLALKNKGFKVVGVDNFNPYYDPKLKRRREEILNSCGIEVIEQDIADEKGLFPLYEKERFGKVLHLAAQAGVRYSLENPRSYVRANLVAFVEILELCRACNLPLVFASSSSVYGLNDKVPFSCEDKTDKPASLYGATKKSDELLAHSYHHLFHFPITALRFFTVYGPYGRPDMAYYSFSEKILKEESIPIFNNGEMERDFTYIDDIVSGILAAIDKNTSFHCYNLGNNHPEKLMDMIALLEKHLGKKAQKEFLPMQKGDVEKTYADIEREKIALDFAPKTSLDAGLKKFAEWFLEQERQKAPSPIN